VLLGDEQELRRQAREIDYLEGFLKYQQEGDSMQCVYTWHIHEFYRQKLVDFQFFRREIDTLLDAKIEGEIKVVEDVHQVSNASNLNQSPKKQSNSLSSSPAKLISPKRPSIPPHVSSVSPVPSAPYAISAEQSPVKLGAKKFPAFSEVFLF
jgi:hypothetical protein